MFCMSTSWNANRHNDARSMVEEIKKLGIVCIELNFQLSREKVNGVAELVDENVIKVCSLHNFCPVPDSVDVKDASPDYYSLSSIDRKEREMAVTETKRTIDTACRLKAKAVVAHSGRLNIKDRTRELAKAMEEGINPLTLVTTMRMEREEELKKGYLDSLLKSIDEISEYARNCGIMIGLENRFYFREMPSIEEFKVIFDNFSQDRNVCYWHDAGHAQVFENLGLTPHKEHLDNFSSRLIGVHLHDVKGIIDDHKAPLKGHLDFSILKPYLTEGTLKILEPHAPATGEEIIMGMEYLKQLYGEE